MLENFEPVESAEALSVADHKIGEGEAATPGCRVRVHYTGALANNGVIFQSSLDSGKAISFGLDEVIAGWTQGIPGMRVGGIRRLIIPADMAYGAASPAPNIPANSDLVFDIELFAVS